MAWGGDWRLGTRVGFDHGRVDFLAIRLAIVYFLLLLLLRAASVVVARCKVSPVGVPAGRIHACGSTTRITATATTTTAECYYYYYCCCYE